MLSNEDARDLNIYIKHFIIKTCQSIVSLRSNITKCEHLISGSTASAQSDWFNISIGEYTTVTEQVKSLYNGNRLDLSKALGISVFISTVDTKLFLIEKWRISMVQKTEETKSGWKVDFYNHLAAILKSILIIGHSNFIYRLCKLSTNNGYSVSYDIQFEDDQTEYATHDLNQQKIGSAICPVGVIEVFLFWKEKQDFSLFTSCNIEPTNNGNVHSETQVKHAGHSNQVIDLNGRISLAYGRQETKGTSPASENLIPFNKLLTYKTKSETGLNSHRKDAAHFNGKEEFHAGESSTQPFDGISEDRIAINDVCVNAGSIFKKSSCMTSNIQTPFAYSKNDAQLFYQICSEVQPLNIFKNTNAAKEFELDELLTTLRNNAKPFSNFINQLASVNT